MPSVLIVCLVISKLNEALTSLWTQITHNGEPVELSGSKAQELVETTIRRLRDSGEEVTDEFRDLLSWQLTCKLILHSLEVLPLPTEVCDFGKWPMASAHGPCLFASGASAACFPIEENALRGIHGIFGVTSRVVCPANRTFSCALTALSIPLAEEERTPIQALEASICGAFLNV